MIGDDRRAEHGHVHAQLVLATGDRLQPVMPGTRAALDDVDERLAVGLAIDLAHAEERLATDEPRTVDAWELEPRQRRSQRLVGLVDGAPAEQRLVERARFAIGRAHGGTTDTNAHLVCR